MRRKNSTRLLALAVAATFSTAAVAGCGSSSSTGGSSASAKSGGMTNITILRSATGGFEPVILAQKLGLYKKAGLNVTVKVGTGNASATIPQVINNQLQFAAIDGASLVTAVSRNVPIEGVVQIINSMPTDPADEGLVVPPNSSIHSLAEMKGKSIGVVGLGNAEQVASNMALQRAGVPLSSVKFVQLPPSAMVPAATSGKVDAIEPFLSFYEDALQAHFKALDGGTGKTIPGVPDLLWVTSKSYAASNPAVVKKFVKVTEAAQTYANAHPAAIRTVDDTYTELPKAYIAHEYLLPYRDAFTTTALTTMSTALKAQGFTQSAPTLSSLLWTGAPKVS
jgi:NitT/TauT family transport system substrate-binding protein